MIGLNGKVSLLESGKEIESPYHADGDKITFTIIVPDAGSLGALNFSLVRNKDGSLDGGIFGQFTKQ
jgi:hypothetical protein